MGTHSTLDYYFDAIHLPRTVCSDHFQRASGTQSMSVILQWFWMGPCVTRVPTSIQIADKPSPMGPAPTPKKPGQEGESNECLCPSSRYQLRLGARRDKWWLGPGMHGVASDPERQLRSPAPVFTVLCTPSTSQLGRRTEVSVSEFSVPSASYSRMAEQILVGLTS